MFEKLNMLPAVFVSRTICFLLLSTLVLSAYAQSPAEDKMEFSDQELYSFFQLGNSIRAGTEKLFERNLDDVEVLRRYLMKEENQEKEKLEGFFDFVMELENKSREMLAFLNAAIGELESIGSFDEETGVLMRPGWHRYANEFMIGDAAMNGGRGSGRAMEIRDKFLAYYEDVVQMGKEINRWGMDGIVFVEMPFDLPQDKTIKLSEEIKKISWEIATFDHRPIIASITAIESLKMKTMEVWSDALRFIFAHLGPKNLD
ncbi:MAG: hypothetical protein AAF570_13650 [Bacteroidota bacterium]